MFSQSTPFPEVGEVEVLGERLTVRRQVVAVNRVRAVGEHHEIHVEYAVGAVEVRTEAIAERGEVLVERRVLTERVNAVEEFDPRIDLIATADHEIPVLRIAAPP